ncbi:MAG: crossover junction endodeoxyribonuclease RuvC [Desulfovibrionaceae bacterium]|nr:crossover junction endodeoxyribonuclease RuvC [Desulfovibrionaceae bacterium]
MSDSGGITVIGIDPGSTVTGWGVVREASGVLSLVACGAIRARGAEFPERLASIYHALNAVLERWQPVEAAVEQVFTAKNASSALKLGQARGVVIAACAAHSLPVRDYPPALVKKSLVGTGRAEKEQVAFMVAQMLGCTRKNWALDTSDALGVALCHLSMRRFQRLAALAQ